jgi:hypothetical protein
LKKYTTLYFPVWHKNGTQEAFLMHVMAVMDPIKKRGHFKDYGKAQKAYDEAKKAIELADAGLALLNRTSAGMKKNHKKEGAGKGQGSCQGSPCKGPRSQVRSQGS